jgi:hypothetical protein
MKELISAIVIFATLVGGGTALKRLHDSVRRAALEKAAHGMPSLIDMNKAMSSPIPR